MVKAAVATALVVIMLSPSNIPDQCDQIVFARSNPGLCYPGPLGSFPDSSGGGGGGNGGILGTIGRVLHGLTGGLL